MSRIRPFSCWRLLRVARALATYALLGTVTTVVVVWIQSAILKPGERWGGASWVGVGIPWPWPAPPGWPKGPNAIDEELPAVRLWSGTQPYGRELRYASRPNEDRFKPDRRPAWYHPPPPGTPIARLMATYKWELFYFMTEIRYGWPIEAMRRVSKIEQLQDWSAPRRQEHDVGTWHHRWRNGLAVSSSVHLPLVPMWPGFAIHAVFWAGFIFGSKRGLSVIRASRRRRAGACIDCGYPTAGLATCPECGRAVLTGSSAA